MSFCYAHDYCQVHKGDAREKGLVYVKRSFSAMCDQTDQKNCDSFMVIIDITVAKQRHKIYQTELHVSVCIKQAQQSMTCIQKGQRVPFCTCMLTNRGQKVYNSHEWQINVSTENIIADSYFHNISLLPLKSKPINSFQKICTLTSWAQLFKTNNVFS